jgi:hypothetical protein
LLVAHDRREQQHVLPAELGQDLLRDLLGRRAP